MMSVVVRAAAYSSESQLRDGSALRYRLTTPCPKSIDSHLKVLKIPVDMLGTTRNVRFSASGTTCLNPAYNGYNTGSGTVAIRKRKATRLPWEPTTRGIPQRSLAVSKPAAHAVTTSNTIMGQVALINRRLL
eukprot:7384218-Prymnesium_polylepis.2